jgi:hypothetical protein
MGGEEMPVLFCINRERKIPSMDEKNERSEIRGTRAGVIYLDIVWKDMIQMVGTGGGLNDEQWVLMLLRVFSERALVTGSPGNKGGRPWVL